MKELIDKLHQQHVLTREEFLDLIKNRTKEDEEYLHELARQVSEKYYNKKVYVRGLIEYTNYCKNDCNYCGIRRSNKNAQRYRLTKEDIMECCHSGYELGFRTFVLQGGEDPYFTKERMVDIIKAMREAYPDCAITLSIGEKDKETYRAFYEAGANRFLLRHETANEEHYNKLHPKEMSLKHRIQCLYDLKEIGFQVGCGFMVGSPYQTNETLVEDLLLINDLQPAMVGMGPFIPHKDTPFKDMPAGTLEDTLFFLSVLRLMLPKALLPSTTALGTIHPTGRELGVLAGGNVCMPNLSPASVRKKYLLYNDKICTGDEAAEARKNLEKRMEAIGYQIVSERGDTKMDGYCKK